jgi:hypothetical protein
MKNLLFIFILLPYFLFSQTKIMVLCTGIAEHDSAVVRAVKYGYGEGYNIFAYYGILNQATIDTAKAHGCKLIVYSTPGAASVVELANSNYPDIVLVMPSGANEYVQSFSGDIPDGIILTGAGVDSNCTSFKIEFWDIDTIDHMNHASYSNGLIGALIALIMDTRGLNIENARKWARGDRQYSTRQGWGKIDISGIRKNIRVNLR